MSTAPVPGGGTVTYLFSQPTSDAAGGEATDEVRRSHLQLLRRAVPGSRALKILGDGVIVVFPSAVEAVGCALAIQRAASGPAGGSRIPPRVALHAGEPIAGEEQYLSAPVVLAQRLCRAAAPGQVVASSVVHALVDARPEYLFRRWEPDGVGDADVECFELEWRSEANGAQAPVPAVLPATGASMFVGRTNELATLEAAWQRARLGERQLVFLTGEPGIGKTSAARQFAARLEAGGATVLFGRCDEEALVPHQPFVEALRHYVMSCPTALLAQQVGDGGSDLVRLVPELADRLPGLPEPLLRGEHHERYRLYEATAALLDAIADTAPVLLVLDDLHWADKPTLLLLRHVLARPEPAAILAIGTYREVGLARTHPLADFLVELRRHFRFERLSLRGLDDDEVAVLVRGTTGEVPRPEFVSALRRHTEGNPFFVRGLLEHLAEHHGDVDWEAGVALDDVGVPEGVRDLVGRRLSSLDERTNRVLAIAAVTGLEFELAVVERVGDWSSDELLDAVERAVAAGLVLEEPGPGRFRFSHNLVRQTLYDELATVRRVRMHQRVGEAIEAEHEDDLVPHLGSLAYHYAEAAAGGAVDEAVHYLAWAALRAADAVAYEEAAGLFQRALQTLEFADEPDAGRQAELMLSLADMLNRAGEVDQGREVAWRAVALVREIGDANQLARAALLIGTLGYLGGGRAPVAVDRERRALLEEAIERLGDGDAGLRARLLSRLALELAYTDERSRMAPLTQRAVELARQAGDSVALGSALSVMDSILWGPDQVQERVAAANELIRLAGEAEDRELALQGYAWRLQAVLEIGDASAFDADVTRYQTLAHELRQPLFVGFGDMFGALRAGLAGEFDDMEHLAVEALAEGQRQNELASAYFGAQMFWVWWQQGRLAEVEPTLVEILGDAPGEFPAARAAMALICVELGRHEEAAAQLDLLAGSEFEDLPRDTSWPVCMTLLTPVCAALGDAGRAAMLHRLMLPFVNRVVVVGPPPAGCYGPAAQYLGMLAATMGRTDDAVADFLLAIQLAQSMRAPAFVAHAQCEYGGLLVGLEDRRREGLRLVKEAAVAADALGLARLARRARSFDS